MCSPEVGVIVVAMKTIADAATALAPIVNRRHGTASADVGPFRYGRAAARVARRRRRCQKGSSIQRRSSPYR